MRALTRLVAVPRIPAPGANPKPRLGKIILPSAAPAEAAPEALSDAVPDAGPAQYDLQNLCWISSKGSSIIIQFAIAINTTHLESFVAAAIVNTVLDDDE